MFIHTVYFWIKPEATAQQRNQLIVDCQELLGSIPTVQKIYVGTPANTPRGVVDNTYGVGITVLFEDAGGHDAYQPHELHSQFIARNEPIWERVVVYDFEESHSTGI